LLIRVITSKAGVPDPGKQFTTSWAKASGAIGKLARKAKRPKKINHVVIVSLLCQDLKNLVLTDNNLLLPPPLFRKK
jgi:hypothetical protein